MLTPWNTAFSEKLVHAPRINKFSAFCEGSLLRSKEQLWTLACASQSSPHVSIVFRIHFNNIILPSMNRPSEWSLPFRFPYQNCVLYLYALHAADLSFKYVILFSSKIIVFFLHFISEVAWDEGRGGLLQA